MSTDTGTGASRDTGTGTAPEAGTGSRTDGPAGRRTGLRPDSHPAAIAARAVQRVTSTALGPYQSAVVRIGFAATWLFFLLRELPNRRELYGPDGPWSWTMAEQLIARNGAFSALMWSDGTVWFETVFAVAVVSSALLLLGWHTRAMSVLFMLGVLSLQNRSIFMGDGGDNVIHLMAIYLVFTRCGQVWSLDARRARRAAAGTRAEAGGDAGAGADAGAVVDADADAGSRAEAEARAEDGAEAPAAPPAPAGVRDRVGPALWGVLGAALLAGTLLDRVESETWVAALLWGAWVAQGLWWASGRWARDGQSRALLDVLANLLHNAALLVIIAEVCLVYATAGWYKIQGSRWQDGTALYFPLKLDYFSPWPALSGLLAASGVVVMLVTYGTVIVQVAFPFTLFNRRVKNVLLVAMIMEHAGIAVLLGLPFFSMAMIAADAVFLPTVFLCWAGDRVSARWNRLFPRAGKRLPPVDRARGREEPARTLVG